MKKIKIPVSTVAGWTAVFALAFLPETAWAKVTTETTVYVNFLNSQVNYGYNAGQPLPIGVGYSTSGGCYPHVTCSISFMGTTDTTGKLNSSYDSTTLTGSVPGGMSGSAMGYAASTPATGSLVVTNNGSYNFANGSQVGGVGKSSASVSDTLHFTVANASAATMTLIPITYTITGSLASTFQNDSQADYQAQISFGNASLNQSLSLGPSTSYVAKFGNPTASGWVTYSITQTSATSFTFKGTYAITGSAPNVPIYVYAYGDASGGASESHTALVSLSLPAGVSFTSDAGFLSGQQPRDFAGNGRTGALLYDPSNGQSYTALSNGDGTYQYVPNLITPAFDILRTGDFNGDGKVDLIVYNSHNALAYIGFGNGDGTFNFQSLFWSPAYDTVATGDINGDGKTDVLLYNTSTGTLYTGISNGDGTFSYQYHLVSQGFTFVALAGFAGSGKADLLLYNSGNGLAFLGVGDGTGNFTFNPLSISPGYNLDAVGDLNGDGKADILLYNSTNGNAATGLSNGSGGFTFTPLVFTPGFTSVHLANYTGDNKASVTVYNKTTAAAYFGTGNGDGTFSFQSLFWSPGYDDVMTGDVNGDGKADVILYNSATGTQYTGLSNGNGTFSYTYWYWGIGKLLAP